MKRRWTKQPPPGTKIDRSNPLASGLVRAILPHPGLYAYNVATGKVLSQGGTGTPTFVSTPLGRARRSFCTDNSTSTDYSDSESLSARLSKEVTILSVVHVNAAPATGEIASGDSGLGGDLLGFAKTRSFPDRWGLYVRQDFSGPLLHNDLQIVAGGLYVLIGTHNRNTTTTTITAYRIDTKEISIATDTVTDSPKDLTDWTRLNWSNNDAFDVLTYQTWNRALSESERFALIDNPWQIFEPPKSFAFADVPEDVRFLPVKTKKPWTTPPPEGTPIDWSNPLTEGLAIVMPFWQGHLRNIGPKYDRTAVLDTNASWQINPATGRRGVGASDTTTVTQGVQIDQSNNICGLVKRTMLTGGYIRGFESASANVFGDRSDGASVWNVVLLQDGTNEGNIGDGWSGGSNGVRQEPELDHSQYPDHIIFGHATDVSIDRSRGAFNAKGRIYGEQAHQFDGHRSYTAGGGVTRLGNARSQATTQVYGVWEFLYFWDRDLSEQELVALVRNPYQIFEPREIVVPVNVKLPDLTIFKESRSHRP